MSWDPDTDTWELRMLNRIGRRWSLLVVIFGTIVSLVGAPSASAHGAPSADAERAVVLRVGDPLQAIVDSHPAGTHFVLESGVHRLQSLRPRDGDRFSGEPEAVMSGAKALPASSFVRREGLWVIEGQTQSSDPHGKMMEGFERDAHNEELFADGDRLRHVPSLSEVNRQGTWFFDYDNDRIWMFDDPGAFSIVETSVTPYAFRGSARGVVIEDLLVRHYATPAQRGAINGRDGSDWTVRYVDSSFNHGAGIGMGERMLVHNSRFTYNGQSGMCGGNSNSGIVVRDTEVAHNKQLGFRWMWEGGGTKFVRTRDMVFENNWVHHNVGPGAWWDIDNVGAVIRSNLAEHNTERAIFYEISYGAKIYWNTVRRQEWDGGDARGIYIMNSADVEVFENAVSDTHNPLWVRHDDRGEGKLGRWESANVVVRNNDVDVSSGHVGFQVTSGEEEYYWDHGNRFEGNTYRHNRSRVYRWHQRVDWDTWRDLGKDRSGKVLPAGGTPSLPAHAVGFTRSHYGPRNVTTDGPGTPDSRPPQWASGSRLTFGGITSTSFEVTWPSAKHDVGVTGYRVSIDGRVVAQVTGRSYRVSGLLPERSYAVSVEARDAAANWSAPLAATVRTSANTSAATPTGFRDVARGSTFEGDIGWLASAGITRGCNPPANDRFCPDVHVTRAQMAAFMVRANGLTRSSGVRFRDVPRGSTFERDIDKLATAGITRGCNPPANDRFCPDERVTRAQMAAFLRRSAKS